MKQAAVVIAFLIITITEGVLIDRQANRNRKNWKLVKKRYVCIPPLLAAFWGTCLSMPAWVILFLSGDIKLFGIALAAVIMLVPLCNRRLELRGNEIILRTGIGKRRTINIDDICEIYERYILRDSVVHEVMFRVNGSRKPIFMVGDVYLGMPELLMIIEQRCPGVVRWDKMPHLKNRIPE